LGIHQLIIQLTDEDYAFKLKIIDQLKRLNPRYHEQFKNLLHGKELNNETIHGFLNELFLLAQEISDDCLHMYFMQYVNDLEKKIPTQ
jgi:hypothetical protein